MKKDEESDNESEDLGIFAGSESIEQMSENKDSKDGNETKQVFIIRQSVHEYGDKLSKLLTYKWK